MTNCFVCANCKSNSSLSDSKDLAILNANAPTNR
jgi:hypothetical protein